MAGIDKVNARFDAVARRIITVPGVHAAFRASLVEDVTGGIGDFNQRVVHQVGDGDRSGIVGADRVGIGIDFAEVVGRGRRVRVVDDESRQESELDFV